MLGVNTRRGNKLNRVVHSAVALDGWQVTYIVVSCPAVGPDDSSLVYMGLYDG